MENKNGVAAGPEYNSGENRDDPAGRPASVGASDPELEEDIAGAGTESAASAWAREREELICLAQRKQADLDNFRRISRAREEEIRMYGLAGFLERLLPVLDNMERALATACADEDLPESYHQGFLMIRNQLLQLLEQEGVVEIEALGKQFDPRYHDAVMQTSAGEGAPGSVVEELQKGYLYKDRVLRHAKVKVMQNQL